MRKIIIATTLAIIMSAALISLTRRIEGRASANNTNSLLLAQGRGTVSINDASLTEGDAGASNMVFTVTVTGSHSNTIGVDYSTANGTAAAPADYISTSGQLVFPPGGNATMMITVPIVGDTIPEPVETFFVNLSIVDFSGDLVDGQGIGTINDTDGVSCTYSISPTNRSFPSAGGNRQRQRYCAGRVLLGREQQCGLDHTHFGRHWQRQRDSRLFSGVKPGRSPHGDNNHRGADLHSRSTSGRQLRFDLTLEPGLCGKRRERQRSGDGSPNV